jgi:hypothetical protein
VFPRFRGKQKGGRAGARPAESRPFMRRALGLQLCACFRLLVEKHGHCGA